MISMHCFFVVEPRAVGPHTPEEDNAFHDADVRFRAGLLSVLGDTIVDAYVPLQSWSSFMTIEWSMTAR
jgi:hypothetical protein